MLIFFSRVLACLRRFTHFCACFNIYAQVCACFSMFFVCSGLSSVVFERVSYFFIQFQFSHLRNRVSYKKNVYARNTRASHIALVLKIILVKFWESQMVFIFHENDAFSSYQSKIRSTQFPFLTRPFLGNRGMAKYLR